MLAWSGLWGALNRRRPGLRFKSTKTEKARAVTLPSFALEELRRWKASASGEAIKVGVRQSGTTLVCCREDGRAQTAR